MELTIEVPEPPKGYEYVGEFRKPARGEYFYSSDMTTAITHSSFFAEPRFILRKVAPKLRPFTLAEAEQQIGKVVESEFSTGILGGINKKSGDILVVGDGIGWRSLSLLLQAYKFIDGSPCGVVE